ncbi:uncharacterized protein LOC135355128 isoform X2 [Latimeria chalumnae]
MALVSQIKNWTTADNCEYVGEKCLYTLEHVDAGKITAKHTTPRNKYVDDLTFTLIPTEGQKSCHVIGFSISELWYAIFDFSTNYCNLHNLVEGSGLDKVPGYTETTSNSECTQYTRANCTVY